MKSYNFDPGMGSFTVGKLLRVLAAITASVVFFAVFSAIFGFALSFFPKKYLDWKYRPEYVPANNSLGYEERSADEFFVLYCRPDILPRKFLAFRGTVRKDLLEAANEDRSDVEDLAKKYIAVGLENMPFHLEGSYVSGEGGDMCVLNGYYTSDGRKIEFHEEIPLRLKYSDSSDYGPLRYNESLKYLPEDVAYARRNEINKNKIETEKLIEEGTALRKYRGAITVILTLASALAIYLLLRYHKKHRPDFSVDFVSSGKDPLADYYFVVPRLKMSARVLGRNVEPAGYLSERLRLVNEACESARKFCESCSDKLPARFEGSYNVTLTGCKIKLRGFYTISGRRTEVEDSTPFDFVLSKSDAFPPDELRPYLGYGMPPEDWKIIFKRS